MKSEFLSCKELCKKFGFKRSTLSSWVHNQKIPHYRFGGTVIRFRKKEIERWITRQKVEVAHR